MAQRLKIEVNDLKGVRDLLQEAYDISNEQIVQSQNEINKLSNSSTLSEEPMEAKAKYAKAINDYLSIKDKAIAKKIEIAKIMSEICKHNGDLNGQLSNGAAPSFDFSEIKKMVDESMGDKKKNVIEIRK